MKLLSRSAPVPVPVVGRSDHLDVRTVVTSGVTALAVMGAVTAASAVVSSLRAKETQRS